MTSAANAGKERELNRDRPGAATPEIYM